MSYPPQPEQPGYGQNGGYPDHPGGYGPPPGGDPNYGPPSGPQPGYGPQAGPQPGYASQSGPQPGYGQGYQQPQYPAPMYGYQQPYGHPGGQYAPSADDRTMALVAHLGGLLTGFLLPLILFLVKKEESPFVRDQAAQAFNFQITMLIGYVISWVLMFVIIGLLTILVVFACAVIFAIIAAVAANKGEWYRYPKALAIPMLQ
ncbi:DUF4870 domain-containing protein [Streptomonospora litoralis]|uniref:DUF4870 domain-containing protein n=1 Tax=Streptomonospora litoralis TaxID=2498135 RepID=A0A4P6Q3N8_9ACTN|nr:DUF4870 domain-containing protein [Streptomonospora litoralis]QBI53307.1 hypothetical protein EKD16_07555 [Streptomonospora litoralis]